MFQDFVKKFNLLLIFLFLRCVSWSSAVQRVRSQSHHVSFPTNDHRPLAVSAVYRHSGEWCIFVEQCSIHDRIQFLCMVGQAQFVFDGPRHQRAALHHSIGMGFFLPRAVRRIFPRCHGLRPMAAYQITTSQVVSLVRLVHHPLVFRRSISDMVR